MPNRPPDPGDGQQEYQHNRKNNQFKLAVAIFVRGRE
jgi:hypothetical protein